MDSDSSTWSLPAQRAESDDFTAQKKFITAPGAAPQISQKDGRRFRSLLATYLKDQQLTGNRWHVPTNGLGQAKNPHKDPRCGSTRFLKRFRPMDSDSSTWSLPARRAESDDFAAQKKIITTPGAAPHISQQVGARISKPASNLPEGPAADWK